MKHRLHASEGETAMPTSRMSLDRLGERAGRPQLTQPGHDWIADRIAHIQDDLLPGLRPALVDRERDERDVAEFERLLAESVDLEAFLAEAEVIEFDPGAFDGRIELGMRVQVTLADGAAAWVRPVHPREAALDDERISRDSPLAIAIVGARAGETVWVDAPSGVWSCTVVAVEPVPQ